MLFPESSSPLRGEAGRGRTRSYMGTGISKNIARNLRKNPTEAEKILWQRLRNRQLEAFKFRRQQILGSYVVDFVNLERKLIIELDGSQHKVEKERDWKRDRWLQTQGFEVLRYWNNEVFENVEGVLETIRARLLAPLPLPPPASPSKWGRVRGQKL